MTQTEPLMTELNARPDKAGFSNLTYISAGEMAYRRAKAEDLRAATISAVFSSIGRGLVRLFAGSATLPNRALGGKLVSSE